MSYKIIDSIWFTPSCGSIIGAVVIRTTEDKLKAYLGNGKGWNQEVDEQVIASEGAKLVPPIASAMFPKLNQQDFI